VEVCSYKTKQFWETSSKRKTTAPKRRNCERLPQF
jgi:hypothetical protein